MENLKNSVLLKAALKALYAVAGRRTSEKLADEAIGSTIKTLEGKFDFLKYVKINEQSFSENEFDIDVASDIDSIEPARVGEAIEAIIRVVYTDLNVDAGLYFVTELKEYAGKRITSEIVDCDVDLDQLQLEQHYFYRRQERKKTFPNSAAGRKSQDAKQLDTTNLLGYTWGEVASWKHEPGTQFCALYNEKGRVLDRLNLDRIIQNYVDRLSGYTDMPPSEYGHEIEIYEKEYELLELMYSRDMDIETAVVLLHISKEKLNSMIRKLLRTEMLQYTSYDTVELTGTGVSYLSEKKNAKNK